MQDIKRLRKKIDSVDRRIIRLLLLRLDLVELMGKIKMLKGMRVADKQREAQIMGGMQRHAGKAHLKFMQEVFYKIIQYSKRIQRRSR